MTSIIIIVLLVAVCFYDHGYSSEELHFFDEEAYLNGPNHKGSVNYKSDLCDKGKADYNP